MSYQVTLKQVEQLAEQLELPESLQLIAHLAERLGHSLPFAIDGKREKEQRRQVRLQLVNELLAEVEDVEDDSQGQFDAAEMIRRMRDERITQMVIVFSYIDYERRGYSFSATRCNRRAIGDTF
jgi:hypothetical protein